MPRLQEYSDRLLDAIYDTAAEPELWSSVLAQIADLTGSQGGILIGQTLGARRIYFEFNGRLSEECNRAFKARHIQNPWSIAMWPKSAGQVVLSDKLVPLTSLRRTLFFEEVLRPQDVAHNAMVSLAASGDFRAAFNLCRSERQGAPGPESQAWLQNLVPHLRRSIGLGFQIDEYRALRDGHYRILDQLSAGVVLLDRGSRILYANSAARAHDAPSGPLHMRNRSLTAASPQHAQRLGALVRAALAGAPSGSMSVPCLSDGRTLTILAISVRGKDASRFDDLLMRDAAVMLFIVDPANRGGVSADMIMDTFGLTRAEARVALATSSGLGVPEAAIQLGLSVNTIKTHLRRVFAKTGTGRQAELVRLITSIGLLSGPDEDR